MKMVCIKKGAWTLRSGAPSPFRSPNFGEIVTVVGRKDSEGMVFFYLEGYTDTTEHGNRIRYSARNFRPIIKDEPKASTEKFDFRTKLKQDA